MVDATLLVTYDPAHSARAEEEVRAVLKQAGETAKFLKSDTEGVFLLSTKKPARDLVEALAKAGKVEPTLFNSTYHWTPVDVWVKTDIAAIGKVLKTFDKKIAPEKSWKLDLSKRHFDKFSTTDMILKLTEFINKPKVDLDKPQLIVKIEVLGNRTGCSLLEAGEILDTTKLK